jgi:hypothetical protein
MRSELILSIGGKTNLSVIGRDRGHTWETRLVALLISLVLPCAGSFPCTLWSATGSAVQNGGTIIAKNRDWIPDNVEVLRKVPETGNEYAFFGIYAEDDDAPGFKAGINEKGLVVVNASASAIPKKERASLPGRGNLVRGMLARYASVATMLDESEKLFGGGSPMFYMIADATEIAYVEISPEGRYSVNVVKNGILAHTNHYLDAHFATANIKIGKSSSIRLSRIVGLLKEENGGLTEDAFIAMSRDSHDGPDDSIWRTGNRPGRERTLATWVVKLPAGGCPQLYVRLANPGESIQEFRYSLDTNFWSSKD